MRGTVAAVAAGVALVAALGACSDDGPDVTVAKVGRSTVVEVVEAPATVSARATATLRATSEGRVAEVRVKDGQQVRAGQVLLVVSSASAEQALRRARRADASAASTGVTLAPTGLSTAQRRADANARRSFARARRTAQDLADPTLRRQALAALDASQAQYVAARAQAADAVASFRAGLGSLSGAVSALADAQRVQTRAAVAAARRAVSGLTIRAPIGGTVSLTPPPTSSATSSAGSLLDQLPEELQSQAGSLTAPSSTSDVTGPVSVGQPVSSGQAVGSLTDASTLSLSAQVDETDVLLVGRGVRASAELDAVPDATYDATVQTVDPSPTTSTRGGVTFVVRLSLGHGQQADGSIAPTPRPGMSAVARLRVRTARDVIAVPVAGVFRDGRRDAVWLVVSGVARKRLVRLGAQGESQVEVSEGLREGQRIVVRGADRVRAGQRVT